MVYSENTMKYTIGNKNKQVQFWCHSFFIEEAINVTVDVLTCIRLKFSLKIGQNCSKHPYFKTFDRNQLSISIILLQKQRVIFSLVYIKLMIELF